MVASLLTAEESGRTDGPPETVEILVFELARQRYGLLATAVREVVRAVAVTPLPRAPRVVEGVIQIRGEVVPVLDLRARFGLPAKPIDPADHLIVARTDARVVALRVDQALTLMRLETAELQELRALVSGAEYVSWLARLPQDLVIIHDLDTFLSRAEAESLSETLAASS